MSSPSGMPVTPAGPARRDEPRAYAGRRGDRQPPCHPASLPARRAGEGWSDRRAGLTRPPRPNAAPPRPRPRRVARRARAGPADGLAPGSQAREREGEGHRGAARGRQRSFLCGRRAVRVAGGRPDCARRLSRDSRHSLAALPSAVRHDARRHPPSSPCGRPSDGHQDKSPPDRVISAVFKNRPPPTRSIPGVAPGASSICVGHLPRSTVQQAAPRQ
jgi:hypothetical protein